MSAPASRAEITHMTPTSPQQPPSKRTSGNPATQARIDLTVKQQREQQRQEKLAEYQRQLATAVKRARLCPGSGDGSGYIDVNFTL